MRDDLRDILRRCWRAVLAAHLRQGAARGAVAGGLIAAVAMILHAIFNRCLTGQGNVVFPLAAIPGALLPLGAVLGVAAAWGKRADEIQAARRVDRLYGLKERLGTAAELQAAGANSPEAVLVYEQATEMARHLPRRLRVWRGPRRTPAALLLTLLLCGSLLLLPQPDGRETIPLPKADFPSAEFFHRAAAKQNNPELRAMLRQAAYAVEARDEKELQRLIRRLRRAGIDVLPLTGREARAAERAAAISEGEARNPGGSASDAETKPPPDSSAFSAAEFSEKEAAGNSVRLYHPQYDRNRAAADSASSHATSPTPGEESAAAFAWRAAQDRARRAADGKIPDRYRRLQERFSCRDNQP